MSYIDIVFSNFPSPPTGDCQFIEVEDDKGESIRVGEWVGRADGYTALRIPRSEPLFGDRMTDIVNSLKDQSVEVFIDGTEPFKFKCLGASGGVAEFASLVKGQESHGSRFIPLSQIRMIAALSRKRTVSFE